MHNCVCLYNFEIVYVVLIICSTKMFDFLFSDTNALIDYLKMVFNFKQWDQNSMTQMGSTISGIYAMLLICIYVAFAFTELVKYPELDVYLERHGFFLYLFLACDLYFIYIFVSIIRTRRYVRCIYLLFNVLEISLLLIIIKYFFSEISIKYLKTRKRQ